MKGKFKYKFSDLALALDLRETEKEDLDLTDDCLEETIFYDYQTISHGGDEVKENTEQEERNLEQNLDIILLKKKAYIIRIMKIL